MINIKTEKEIEIMKKGGRILTEILKKLSEAVKPGITTWSLEELARELIKAYPGAKPAFFGYVALSRSFKLGKKFPTYLCISINKEVVHGLPSPERIISPGDLVNIDFGIKYKGLITDSAISVLVEGGKQKERFLKNRLLQVTKECLYKGIKQAVVGNTTGDIGAAIQKHAESNNFSVIYQLVGHGVGKKLHEDPEIPNFGKRGKGTELKERMSIAIEPMLSSGSPEVIENESTWAWETEDNSPAAHFEHTVAITKSGPLVLTE